MVRVPYVSRDELDAEGQEIYDRIRQDRNAPEVGLQFRALLHRPRATGYLTSLGAQLRFQSAMPEDLKELGDSPGGPRVEQRHRVDGPCRVSRPRRRQRRVD